MEKSQLNNQEAQSLEMARSTLALVRQSLRRVKEMDLTPEQKEKVMAMIKEAKAAEKVSNLVEALKIYNNLFKELKLIKNSNQILSFEMTGGETKKIEFKKELKYWADFYKDQGIDWVKLPDKLILSEKNLEELETGAKTLCPQGDFDKLKLVIIPEGLADSGIKHEKLDQLLTKGYRPTEYQGDAWEKGGSAKLENKSNKTKIILLKDLENLLFFKDNIHDKTLNLSVTALTQPGGFFEKTGLKGIDAATYLVWQRDYFDRFNRHPDEAKRIYLTENIYEPRDYSLTVMWCPWNLKHLQFGMFPQGVSTDEATGCRLAKTIEI